MGCRAQSIRFGGSALGFVEYTRGCRAPPFEDPVRGLAGWSFAFWGLRFPWTHGLGFKVQGFGARGLFKRGQREAGLCSRLGFWRA